MSTVSALLITGDTYTSRHDLKSLGGKWYPDREGWVVPLTQCEAAEQLAGGKNFIVEIIDVEPVALERPTGERLRGIRQARIDRKVAKKLAKADRLDAIAAECRKKVEPYNDWAFWTEPIKIGHHSEKRHRNLRTRLENTIRRGAEADHEARTIREYAASPPRARIAGDAERKRQALRDKLDTLLGVGSRVKDVVFGHGTIRRVHKKCYTVEFDTSRAGPGTFTCSRDKSFLRPA